LTIVKLTTEIISSCRKIKGSAKHTRKKVESTIERRWREMDFAFVGRKEQMRAAGRERSNGPVCQ
jgi:hypothetical protein